MTQRLFDSSSTFHSTTRRRFLTAGAGATATALTGTRLTFPSGTLAQDAGDGTVSTPMASPIPGSDIVEETSISELRAGLDRQDFSVTEIVEASLARIGAMDAQGPALNAMIELNPDALEIAAQLDDELRQGRPRGPMHGIPVVLKDIFATADNMSTTTGSLALIQNTVVRDAFIVEQMRNAGMVILGKSNLSEWSNYRGALPSGWSSRGGQTVNPYVTTHTPWGSSSGSAVAVAASYTPVSLGSETDGSIICPASACGVVGMKPTVGLVSRQGVLGISFSQDSPGPMGRSVADVAAMLEVMVGYDPEDMAYGAMANYFPAAQFPEFPVPDPGTRTYVQMLDSSNLEGVRVGVVRSMFGFDPDTDVHVESAIEAMREAGAEIVDDVLIEAQWAVMDGLGEALVLSTEFTYTVQSFLDNYMPGGPMMTIQDIVDFYWEHAEETNFLGWVDGLSEALAVSPEAIYDPYYQDQLALNHTLTREQGIDLVMNEQNLDVLVAPSSGIATEIDGGEFRGATTQVPAIAGYPSLTLPVGYTNGLPTGMHMFGRAFSERKLLRYAHGLESTLNIRRPPQYLPELPVAE